MSRGQFRGSEWADPVWPSTVFQQMPGTPETLKTLIMQWCHLYRNDRILMQKRHIYVASELLCICTTVRTLLRIHLKIWNHLQNLTIYHYKINFSPKQLSEKLGDTEGAQSNAGGMRLQRNWGNGSEVWVEALRPLPWLSTAAWCDKSLKFSQVSLASYVKWERWIRWSLRVSPAITFDDGIK